MSRPQHLRRAGLVALAAALSGVPAASRQRAVPPPCPPARYLLPPGTPIGQAVAAGEAAVVLEDVCEAVAPKAFKATRRGTRVRAIWPACDGLTGKVRLTGVIGDGCETLKGTVKARRLRQRVRAVRSRCGDGVIDDGAGERCDPPADASCDAQCRRAVTAPIGVGGGRVASLDGRLTLDVPAGALPADIAIGIRRLEVDELPPPLAHLGATLAWALEPDGLAFSAPVTATVQLDPPSRGVDGSIATDLGLLITTDRGGSTVELLANQQLMLDGTTSTATALGTLTHFSFAAFVLRNPATGNLVGRGSATPSRTIVPVGQPFAVDVVFELFDVRGGTAAVVHTDETIPGAVRYGGARVVQIGNATPDEPRVRRSLEGYACVAFGSGAYRGRVAVSDFAPSVQLMVGIDCVVALPTTTSTTRPAATSTTRPPTSTTRPSTSTTSSSSTTSSTATSTTSSSTSTTSTTSTTITGCCECAQGCASGPTVTEQRCESANTVCTPGPGSFVPAAFCDQAGTGNCVRVSTTTTTTRPATCGLDPGSGACGGPCPTGVCVALPSGTCACVTPGAACGNGGPLCPHPNDRCDPRGVCRPRQPCGLVVGDDDFPACFGDCPTGQLCAADRDGCTCVPFSSVCQPQTGNVCGGLCPSPRKACVSGTLPGGTLACTCVEVD